jgi:hypothetical protein
VFYKEILRSLLWIDERPIADLDAYVRLLLGGSLGVYGKFCFQHLRQPDMYVNEVASAFAEAFFRLGYFTPARLLSVTEFEHLRSQLNSEFFAVDHTQSDMLARFGPPSHDVVGGQTTVHCYGSDDRTMPWVFFDYSRCYPPEDGVSYDWFDDEILRDIRSNQNKFELLPFSAWLRNSDTDSKIG